MKSYKIKVIRYTIKLKFLIDQKISEQEDELKGKQTELQDLKEMAEQKDQLI